MPEIPAPGSRPDIDNFLAGIFFDNDPHCAEATAIIRERGLSPSRVFDVLIGSRPGDSISEHNAKVLLANRAYCERYIAGVLGYA